MEEEIVKQKWRKQEERKKKWRHVHYVRPQKDRNFFIYFGIHYLSAFSFFEILKFS